VFHFPEISSRLQFCRSVVEAEDAGLVVLGGEESSQGLAELGSRSLESEAVGGKQLDTPSGGDQAARAYPDVVRLDGVNFLDPTVVLTSGFADDAG